MSPRSTRSTPAKPAPRRTPRSTRSKAQAGDAAWETSLCEDEWNLPATPTKSTALSSDDITPKRKVGSTLDSVSAGPKVGSKRDTLQARLAQAALAKKTRSIGAGLSEEKLRSAPDTPPILSLSQQPPQLLSFNTHVKPDTSSTSSAISPTDPPGNDKVIVCVRSVIVLSMILR
jgi:hypothetical protein